MRKFILFVTAAATVIGLSSCNKELSSSSVEFEGTPQLIAMRGYTGTPSVTKSAIDGTTFPDGYDMLVSAYRNLDADHKGDDVAADYFEGIHFKKDATAGTWKEGKYWPLTGTLDFLAIASAGLNNPANGIVPTCVWGKDSNVAKQVVVTVPDNSAKFDDLLFGALNAQKYVSTGNPIAFKHAMAAVVFTAKSTVAYDEAKNVGITIDSISVNGAKYSGTLTVSNPGAAGGTEGLSAVWSDLGDAKDYIFARVWNSANLGTNAAESRLTGLNLTASSKTVGTAAPFGEGYVILPQQAAVPFTVYYTIHNGFKADGTSKLNNQLQYKYTAVSGNWEQAKKYIYDINITLNEISIAPSVVDWANQTVVDVPVNQPAS